MTTTVQTRALSVARIEVWPASGEPDLRSKAVIDEARAVFGFAVGVACAKVYLIESTLDEQELRRVAGELLADPVSERFHLGAAGFDEGRSPSLVEVHYLPGVMDPVAQSTRDAIGEMFPEVDPEAVQVRTGVRFDLLNTDAPPEALRRFAERSLANAVVQETHLKPFHPPRFPQAHEVQFKLRHVPLRELDDAALMKMSREAHLFLSLEEMRCVRDYFRAAQREPTDIELETLAQTWSEHCVHKTLKSRVRYRGAGFGDQGSAVVDRPGHRVERDGTVVIDNLLKSTIAAATAKLMTEEHFRRWCVSVFKDNSGVVRFDEQHAVCVKVETHNHPSAIEPYGGAATGIGGCIRDVMGTGLAAKPIANTDVFCVALPEVNDLPKGVIAPKRILKQVVAGVRDYGNRMGIPTVNGAVYFHEDYLGNPLVFAGCVGLIPLDKCFGAARSGDRIIAIGGRTGRDGIHGATFSSAELTDTHAHEFAHAVQIGNAITQKRTLDVILRARDHDRGCLFSAITDCGAGGFSSAVGEMGAQIGARVNLDQAPLKYAGLSYTEIWISEAQERMVLAVAPDKVPLLGELCDSEGVELCDLGEFGFLDAGQPTLVLQFRGVEVGRLSMGLLHEGIPTPVRDAVWSGHATEGPRDQGTKAEAQPERIDPGSAGPWIARSLHSLLSHPNIASKHWIVRQYDHEVQGGSVVKPLCGSTQSGPSDASVLRPKLSSQRGIAIACGLQTGLSEKTPGGDSYWMALAAIDEAVRNLVCVGADPSHIAILDNFCWPRCDQPENLGSLVRAAEGCHDGALAYRTPFVSGKDSLNNQFTTEQGKVIAIPPTLLITGLGIVCDVTRCVTMDLKSAGNVLLMVGVTDAAMGGAHATVCAVRGSGIGVQIPHVDLRQGPANAKAVAELIAHGRVASAHDCSDGGMLVAAAEMAFASDVGLDLELDAMPAADELSPFAACFSETPSRYLLEVAPKHVDAVIRHLRAAGVPFGQVGLTAKHDRLTLRSSRHGRLIDEPLESLRNAWLKPLDW